MMWAQLEIITFEGVEDLELFFFSPRFSRLCSIFNDQIVSFDFLTGKFEDSCADTNFYNLVNF